MGFAVYEQPDQHRWAGYGVPGECDLPSCSTAIRRGTDALCDSHHWYSYMADGEAVTEDEEWDEEVEHEDLIGCGFYFCSEHRHQSALHAGAVPKPDTPEWERHLLTDSSWAAWRAENLPRVIQMVKRVSEAGLGGPLERRS